MVKWKACINEAKSDSVLETAGKELKVCGVGCGAAMTAVKCG
jgi:hypothetical protein